MAGVLMDVTVAGVLMTVAGVDNVVRALFRGLVATSGLWFTCALGIIMLLMTRSILGTASSSPLISTAGEGKLG